MNEKEDEGPLGLERLGKEVAPPPALEGRVTSALSDVGLIRSPRRQVSIRAAAWLLPLLAGFAVGWIVRGLPVGETETARTRYVLLLYGEPGTAGATSDAVAEYASWAQTQQRGGSRVTGEKLEPGGETVGTSRPGVEEMLGGLFIIPAQTDEEARRIAEQHPHVKRGGTIVIRRIDPT